VIRRGLSDAERVDWLRLARTANVGPVTFARLIERYGDASSALDALPGLARRGGRAKPLTAVSADDARAELDALDALGGRLIAACEPEFPRLLAVLDPPPPVISVVGAPALFDKPACAIVGARNASGAGLRLAGEFAQGIGEEGVVAVSGLARGIDGAAHAASLRTGTIAVLAGGVDVLYPPQHGELRDAIAREGALVSERRLGLEPTARDFPRRNRLISGLSLGVVVVEAAERSGSLITARLALEQNREVMAAPGSPLDPRARGANLLIREGAALVQDAGDILGVLSGVRPPDLAAPDPGGYDGPPADPAALDDEADRARARILELLSPTPMNRDEIARLAGVDVRVALAVLVELELAGRCELDASGQVRSL